jgi:hypothetical protein
MKTEKQHVKKTQAFLFSRELQSKCFSHVLIFLFSFPEFKRCDPVAAKEILSRARALSLSLSSLALSLARSLALSLSLSLLLARSLACSLACSLSLSL